MTLGDEVVLAPGDYALGTVGLSINNALDVHGATGAEATLAEPRAQVAAPLLANQAAGDFHQLAGSPTINAGSASASGLADLDLDGELRMQGLGSRHRCRRVRPDRPGYDDHQRPRAEADDAQAHDPCEVRVRRQ